MWKVTLKGLLSHKLRLVLTALSIVLGVSFVTGTYVLTDTINRTFTNLFNDLTEGVDVAVRSQASYTGQQGEELRAPMPASLRDQIAKVDGVKVAEGSVIGYAQFVGKDGKAVTTGGAPTLGVSFAVAPELQSSSTLRSGKRPAGPSEVAIDAATAEKEGFRIGDKVKILLQSSPREFTVAGIVGFGNADNLAGATLAAFDLPTAQQVLGRTGKYDEIDVVAAAGVGEETLRDRIGAAVGPSYQALTGEQLAKEASESVGTFVNYINYALLAFAFVALFVGSFIIVNTFSIILAQRTRELALLRCLGASRRQLLRSVLAEAAIVGLVASVIGLGLGILVAIGLQGLFEAFGADLPSTSLQVKLRTIILAFVVGIGVTVGAALWPALRATRVSPVEGLHEGTHVVRARTSLWRVGIGAVMTLAGVVLLLTGLFSDQGNALVNVGAGAFIILLGVGVLSPLFARPLARLIGWPFAHWAGQPGKLARENAMRSPRRTASTAAALMIGLALVSFVSIFATSIKASATEILDKSIAADYILTGPSNSGQGFSPEVVKRLATLPEVEAATGIRFGNVKIDGKSEGLGGIDPVTYDRTVRTDTTSGNLTDLASGGLAISEETAESRGWKVGDSVAIEFPVGGRQQVQVKAVYEDNQLNGGYLLSLTDYQKHFQDQFDTFGLVKAKASPDATRAAIDRVVADFPNVEVRDQAEFKQEQAGQVDQILILFYVLLALAVIIAVIGIINTLALSVLERVRELGLLRAVGMTKRQLRAMIRWEAVVISVLGAVLGLIVGSFFGWTMVQSLQDEGITEFALPIGSLLAFVLIAALAGVLAAILPGRRATRVDILQAIAAE